MTAAMVHALQVEVHAIAREVIEAVEAMAAHRQPRGRGSCAVSMLMGW